MSHMRGTIMHTSQTRKHFAIITALTAGLGLLALTSVASKADDKPAIEVITHLSLIHI